jgi:Putative auto-transporter adhesin, head GIN domain
MTAECCVGRRQSAVVHADSNLLGNVTTRVVAGTLIIDTTGSFTTKSRMNVEVSVPLLTALTLSGSGQVSVTGIDAPQLTVSLPGSGTVYAGGTVTQLDVTLDGSGLAQLDNLAARDVRAVGDSQAMHCSQISGQLAATWVRDGREPLRIGSSQVMAGWLGDRFPATPATLTDLTTS